MTNPDEFQANYVRRVQEETRNYVQDLLAENARLRTGEAELDIERLRLTEHVAALEAEIGGRRHQQKLLERRLTEIEGENRRFSEKYAEVEQQNSNLANLYVASYRLHGTLDREEVLAVIQEILINLVGSEEIGLFELPVGESELRLAASFGIDSDRYRSIPLGEGILGSVASTGETYVSGMPLPASMLPGEQWLTAAIPLKLPGRVLGVIAVFRLLEQKAGIGEPDLEMFDLLATHAATAFYCTTLHARNAASGAERS